jgi:hypothetical protein
MMENSWDLPDELLENQETLQLIVLENEIIENFFKSYQFTSNSQAQSPKFPSDHKSSGPCFCSVCNKPGPSRSI